MLLFFAKCTKGTVPALFVDPCSAVFICILIYLDDIDNCSIPPLSFILLPNHLRNNWSATASYCKSIYFLGEFGCQAWVLSAIASSGGGWFFCEKFRHLKDWYFGLIPACRDPTMSAVEAAQECWGTQSCLGQKQCFLMFFGFICRLEHYFVGWDWQHGRKGISKDYNK